MLSIQSLQKISGGLRSSVAALRSANDALNAKIAQFESDKTRSQSYVAENVKAAREAALAKAQADLASMREAAQMAAAQAEFWSSRALLLSRIPFDPDPAVDALQRTRYAAELAAMDAPLLALTQKNAMDDGNLALVWACAMAARASGAGSLADLSAVEIPGQQHALDLITDCDAAIAEVDLLIGAMAGLNIDPVRKLTLGRRIQSDPPVAHNSPGRPVTP